MSHSQSIPESRNPMIIAAIAVMVIGAVWIGYSIHAESARHEEVLNSKLYKDTLFDLQGYQLVTANGDRESAAAKHYQHRVLINLMLLGKDSPPGAMKVIYPDKP